MNRPTAYGTLLALPIAAGLVIYSLTTESDAPTDGAAAAPSASSPAEADPVAGTRPRSDQPAPRASEDTDATQDAAARPDAQPVLRPQDVAPPTMGPAPAPVSDPILAKMIESFSMDQLRDEGFWDMGRPGERERALALAARIPVESGEIAESFNTALSRHWRERIDTVGVAAARQERVASTHKPIDPDSLPRRR